MNLPTAPASIAIPADRLTFTANGHADPAQLAGLITDADTRVQSTGLTYLAEHTRTADLTEPPAVPEQTDREINERVAQQHPHMKPVTDRPTSRCVFDGTPSVAVRTGQLGNRYGLCTECAKYMESTVEASEPKKPGATWTVTTSNEVKVGGYLPGWADEDPSESDLDPKLLEICLADLVHYRSFDGQTVTVDTGQSGAEDGRYRGPAEILHGGIYCHPHSDNPAERVPVVNVEILEGSDDWMENLDPDGIADLAAKLRAQADRLDNEVRPTLIAARADWAKNGGAK